MKKYKEIQKSLKTMNLIAYVYIGLTFLLLGVALWLVIINNKIVEDNFAKFNIGTPNPEANYSKLTNITFENLNPNEIYLIKEIMDDVKPIYLAKNHNIIFTSNITKYCNDCSGTNYNDGEEIVVLYQEDIINLKTTIAHELLHSYIFGEDIKGENAEHKIVYDLGEQMGVFENDIPNA